MASAVAGVDDFTVTVKMKEKVAAVLPLQDHLLPLSNLDLLLPPLDVGIFFCYKKPSSTSTTEKSSFPSVASALKKSLAQALVSYYAFSSEFIPNSLGEPELFCNNRGVNFYKAYADIELQHLHLYNPDATVEGKLVPKKKEGVFCVQATEFKCSGVVVACSFDHRVADAYSMNMFLVSWAEMAQSKPISTPPSFRRSLLNPRRPSSYDVSIDDMYVPQSSTPPPENEEQAIDDDKIISRIYYVTAQDINGLQARASSGGCKRTKLESLSACLWQIVAKSERDSMKRCKLGIVVDGRTRLSDGDRPNNCMSNYFGNVLSIPHGEEIAKELATRPLSWVAELVHKTLRGAASKEHFLGLIDWVEARRPQPAMTKIYCRGREDGAAFVVSLGQRFPVERVDFGWGKSVFGSYHFPWGGYAGYVMPMPSASREGDWVVNMHMFKEQLDMLEGEEGHIFHPLSPKYLNLAATAAATFDVSYAREEIPSCSHPYTTTSAASTNVEGGGKVKSFSLA
ncbi:coniferyl alcohol acyltransferase-like [Magnolia sinica]|uniref:coniferyl alcohol acyltransferase-like n=1 Tax=Magnolia sinica TaxID=86752 RepID=UPI002659BE78|nr:coniferyl alcohol acyltransferase-like [Magnolia sinica]